MAGHKRFDYHVTYRGSQPERSGYVSFLGNPRASLSAEQIVTAHNAALDDLDAIVVRLVFIRDSQPEPGEHAAAGLLRLEASHLLALVGV